MCQQPKHVLSLSVLWIWSSFSLLWPIRKGDVIIFQYLGQHVNLLLHTGALRMIVLTTICALTHFSFVLLGALGLLLILVLVSLLLRWLLSFLLSFLIHPRISSNQILVFGRFDCAHHHQFILFLCEGFHELSKLRKLLGSSYQLGGMEGKKKHWIVRSKLQEYGQNQFPILLFDPTLF